MTKRIFQAVCLVAAMVLVLSTGVLLALFYDNYVGRAEQSLRTEAAFVAQGLNTGGEDYLLGLTDRSRRITLVDQDGTVRYDNTADAGQMENHLEREEIQEALSTGSGQSRRVSETLSQETFYYAILLENGMVLRLAATQSSVWALLLTVLQPAAMVVIAALVLGAILAHRAAKAIVAPINSLDLDQPEDAKAYEELSPLLSRIARQKRTIDAQLHRARRQQEQFRLITENMSEGLLVVDSQTNLLSCNSAALRLLGAEKQPENPSVLALNHAEAFRTVIRDALAGRHGEGRLEVGGRSLQLLANPAGQEGEAAGAVILVMDTTEREQREALRREFSANVSHELKTPLTSISGFAEIIKNGIVKPEDIPRFAGNIYEESQRLVTLVDDILNLSRLDEADVQLEREDFDLSSLARDVAGRLKASAKKNGVVITVIGDKAEINGVKSIVDEMVFNLVDNAVKYNKQNGRVTVTVDSSSDGTALTVTDTGIGIPQADVDRVFERFYRVDKSHSKEIGGTGLGLSIVKHGAAFHNAKVSLQSTEGEGTTVRLVFPN